MARLSGKAKKLLNEWAESAGSGLGTIRRAADALWGQGDVSSSEAQALAEIYESGAELRSQLEDQVDSDGLITLYRGLRESDSEFSWRDSVESFTTSAFVARAFAGDGGRVEVVRVPVDDVITDNGDAESEILVRRPGQQAAPDLDLATQTETDLAEQAAARAESDKAEAQAKRDADQKERADAERAFVKGQSEAAADTFELGGNAMDNLTGQSDAFSATPSAEPDTDQSVQPEPEGAIFTKKMEAYAKSQDDIAADWGSRNYKNSKQSIDLQGDGPKNSESVSVNSVNEKRRRRRVSDALRNAKNGPRAGQERPGRKY